jgi:hypothetical protein
MRHAFERVPGFETFMHDLQAETVAANFIQKGGTLEAWLDGWAKVFQSAAARMLGESHKPCAADGGHDFHADARQPEASGEGQRRGTQHGHSWSADPARSPTVEEGQRMIAQPGQFANADLHHPIVSAEAKMKLPEKDRSAVPPAREPKRKPPSDRHSKERRAKDHAAARRVAAATARGLLNSIKVPDGRGIGKCRLSEMTGKATDDVILAGVKLKIHAYAKSHLITRDPLVEEIISERLLEKFLAEARREAREPAVNKYQRGVVINPEGHIGVMM